MRPRVLIAGMGNVLCGDDGFGVAVMNALATRTLPPGIGLLEVGIGGMHLVQELMSGYDALIIVDAVDRAEKAGTLFVLEPHIPDLEAMEPEARYGLLAETHHTVPVRALSLAKALGVLPEKVLMVGCQPGEVDELGLTLSPAVAAAVDSAVCRIEAVVAEIHGAPAALNGRPGDV